MIVDRPAAADSRIRLTLQAETLQARGQVHAVTGRIRVTVAGNPPDLSRGDRIRFPAKIRAIRNFHNAGGFDYRRYMDFKRIHGTAWTTGAKIDWLSSRPPPWVSGRMDRVRQAVTRLIEMGAGAESRAVLKALIVGDRSEITPPLREVFNRSGIGHLLAISGLHIGIVAFVVFRMFRQLLARFDFFLWRAWSGKGTALISLAPVIAYGLMAGMSPSTQRAVIMISVFLMALVFERAHDPINTLALAALLIVTIVPPSVFSISFQLSFTAVLFILCGLPAIAVQPAAGGGVVPRFMRKMTGFLWVSLLAIAGTLPLVMAYFNQVSLIGLLTNCIFVPLIGFCVVPVGLLAVFLRLLNFQIALWIIRLDAWVLDRALELLHFFSELPFAAVRTITPNIVEICAFYGLAWAVLATMGPLKSAKDHWITRRFSNRSVVVLIAALSAAVLAGDAGYWLYQRFYLRGIRVTVLDVGQGSAALLELPRGDVFLVDGGGFADNAAFDMGQRVVAPFLWRKKIRTVDTVVLTHPNSDHLNGLLYVLGNFRVRRVWANGEPAKTAGYERFLKIIRNQNIRMPAFEGIPRTQKKNGVTFSILHPPKDYLHRRTREPWRTLNNNSLVLKVGFGDVSFLFTGDIMAAAEAELVETAGERLKSTVLMAPHHGSRTGSSPAFLDRVAPDAVAISAGWKNRYRFPHAEVLQRYRQKGCRTYCTDRHGAVTFFTDGRRLEVRTQVARVPVRAALGEKPMDAIKNR